MLKEHFNVFIYEVTRRYTTMTSIVMIILEQNYFYNAKAESSNTKASFCVNKHPIKSFQKVSNSMIERNLEVEPAWKSDKSSFLYSMLFKHNHCTIIIFYLISRRT